MESLTTILGLVFLIEVAQKKYLADYKNVKVGDACDLLYSQCVSN
jgi:hypothetical protein